MHFSHEKEREHMFFKNPNIICVNQIEYSAFNVRFWIIQNECSVKLKKIEIK